MGLDYVNRDSNLYFMNNSFLILLKKIDGVVRKSIYHKLFKIVASSIVAFLILFIVFVLFEYFYYIQAIYRKAIFFGFIGVLVIGLIYISLNLVFLIRRIGDDKERIRVSGMIGNVYKNDIGDKLINILQLNKLLIDDNDSKSLVKAGILQKSEAVSNIGFDDIISFRDSFRMMVLFFVLSGIYMSGFFFMPEIFKDPATRIVNYNTEFNRIAPFQIKVLNEMPLVTYKNENFILKVRIDGDVIPELIELSFNEFKTRMIKGQDRRIFEFEFRNLESSSNFYLISGGFKFGPYQIKVAERALIKSFVVEAVYPVYTGFAAERFVNQGDISVPEGTDLNWTFFTADVDSLYFMLNDSVDLIAKGNYSPTFMFQKRALSSFHYSFSVMNESSREMSWFKHQVNVVKDSFPSISIDLVPDSVLNTMLFVRGNIRDDYGFSDLSFHYILGDEENVRSENDFTSLKIPLEKDSKNQIFYYSIDFRNLGLSPGKRLDYFFKISDNDAFNGPKSSISEMFTVSLGNRNELVNEFLNSDEITKSKLESGLSDLENIQNDIDNLRRAMMDNENVTWEQREVLRNLLEKQKSIEEKVEKARLNNEMNNFRRENLTETDKKILDKQREVEKLFDEVMSDELKNLYKQIEEELQKLTKENVLKLLEKFQFEMNDFENKLDRALQLLKQLQVERMLYDAKDRITEIRDDVEKLKSDTQERDDIDNLKEKNQSINDSFNSARDFMESLRKLNQELIRPFNIENTENIERDVMNSLRNSLNELGRNNRQRSLNHQNDASQRLQNLSELIEESINMMEQENLAEDIRTLREILDNLIKVSFTQEELMNSTRDINLRDPRYIHFIQQQKTIKNDLELIKDSLIALSKRQIQIQGIVTREITEINLNIESAIDNLVERRKFNGISRQQFVMTHINNLALLLNESMQNMRSQMQAQSGKGEPMEGQGMEGIQEIRKMQEKMNNMLEQLRQGMIPDQGMGGEGNTQISERLARMAAEQEAIRNRLNELIKNQGSGNGLSEIEQTLREMERTELDLVNRNISRQTMIRQERIVSRLLEHERALLEQDKEERRVGETAKFYNFSNPESFFEYKKSKIKTAEMLRQFPPGFNPFFKNLVESYFLNVQE